MTNKELAFQLDLLELDIRSLWKMYDNLENEDTMEIAWQQKKIEKMEEPIIDSFGWNGVLIIRKMMMERLGKETYS